jgi:hypothetical protein
MISQLNQSRLMSLVEATTNVVVGFALALATQVLLFPLLGLIVTMQDNMIIGSVFTVVSLLRGFLLRRLFESFTARFRQNSLQ